MYRSFGFNLAHTIGVINIPEVRNFVYTGGEKFIVIIIVIVFRNILIVMNVLKLLKIIMKKIWMLLEL